MKTEKISTKKNKRSYIIIALIIILLLLGVGYASFSETLTISGTAEGNMDWDVRFETEESTGVEESVDGTGHILTVTTNDLKYPGDAVKVPAIIANNSSVGIKLKSFEFEQTGKENSDITIDYTTLTEENEKIAAGGKCKYYFVIKWNEDSNRTSVSDTYTFKFTYEQDTKNKELKPFHSTHS